MFFRAPTCVYPIFKAALCKFITRGAYEPWSISTSAESKDLGEAGATIVFGVNCI